MVADVPSPTASGTALKVMALRRPDTCICGTALAVGERAAWDRSTRTVRCLPCAQDSPPVAEDSRAEVAAEKGIAGGSAQQEFERRHSNREARIRKAHPRLGGVIVALTDDPQSTRAWQSGAVGERKLGEKLAGLGDTVIPLHDRRIPNSRANLDHVVVGPAGVFVIDAKRYKNAKIAVRRSGGFLSQVRTQLIVSGRDQTKLVAAMDWQVAAVRAALCDNPEFAGTPITAALCFIDAEFPLFGTIEINEVRVRGLGGTAKLVSTAGALDAAARERLAAHLSIRLPPKM